MAAHLVYTSRAQSSISNVDADHVQLLPHKFEISVLHFDSAATYWRIWKQLTHDLSYVFVTYFLILPRK